MAEVNSQIDTSTPSDITNVSFAALIGGITNNYQSNFIGKANPDVFIVEADEFDRSLCVGIRPNVF